MSDLPVVAIVGRPNVGKSTLFNRLTGKRTALVSDLPGLTRDRKEGEAQLSPKHKVRLVDTAGLEEAAPGSIAARMRQQSETAIAQSDLVLFVIDAREGVTPADEAFARAVRASGKPVILVANKAEGRAGTSGFYDAFALGLGEPVAISAEHGEGVGDLVLDVMNALGLDPLAGAKPGGRRRRSADDATEAEEIPPAEPATSRPIRVAIVGRPNAGKSTLVNALIGDERMLTGPEPGLTRDTVSTEYEWGARRFLLFDTAGLRRKAKVTEIAEKLSTSDTIRAVRFAEVVVLVIDAEHPFENQDLTIGAMAESEGRALVLAINKWDLVVEKQKALKDLREKVDQALAQVPGVPMVAISALGERGLEQLMKAVIAAYDTWNRRVPTPDLNRWLQEAVQRHAPPAASGRRIRLRYVTQPSARPPTFVAFCSRPAELPKSYVRYLTNSLRAAFDLPGVPIRFNLKKGENPYASRADGGGRPGQRPGQPTVKRGGVKRARQRP